jgi:hypothetical protein
LLFNSPALTLNGLFVERVQEHKHLGIYLSSTLAWTRQIHETSLRANRKLAVLRSIKYLKRSTLDLLYKVCVRSTLEYGLVIYWHTLKQTEKAQLSRIQYRGAKICSGALHLTSQLRLEQDLSLESIANRAKFLGLSIFHKIHLGLSRPLIKSCMPEVNTNNTRGGGLYKKLNYMSQKYNNSFFPLFSEYWSKLSSNLRNEKDILLFKENLKPSFKPKRQKHFSYGDKRANTLHCRLRVGRSFLKSHSFAINMSTTDRCPCGEIDTTQSYFLTCFLFQNERHVLFEKICQVLPKFKKLSKSEQCDILLYGINRDSVLPDPRNKVITFAVQGYITKTNRFSKHYD